MVQLAYFTSDLDNEKTDGITETKRSTSHAGAFCRRDSGAAMSRVPRRSKSLAPILMTGAVLMAGGAVAWSAMVWIALRIWN
jgi:hypothetical protein